MKTTDVPMLARDLAPLILPGLILLLMAAHEAWTRGRRRGEVDCDARWRERWDASRRQGGHELAAGAALAKRHDDLTAKHARQRLRLRGALREARRWKAVATALGWRRGGASE